MKLTREEFKDEGGVLELKEKDGDSLSITIRGDTCFVETYERWAGDTYSGFGATCNLFITRENATHIKDFLTKVLK